MPNDEYKIKGIKSDLYKDDSDEEDYKRRKALAKEFDVKIRHVQVSGEGEHLYTIIMNTGEERVYAVYDNEEANRKYLEHLENLVDDCGLEAFGKDNAEIILSNYAEPRDYFDDWIHEMNYSYIEDIESESDSEFDNRLIRELYEDADLLSDDDFYTNRELVEDGEIEDLYEDDPDSEEALDWYDEVNYEYLRESVDIEYLKEKFCDQRDDEVGDSIDYIMDEFGIEEINNAFKDGGLYLDYEGIANYFGWDRGNELNYYDGSEIALEGDYYAYRQD